MVAVLNGVGDGSGARPPDIEVTRPRQAPSTAAENKLSIATAVKNKKSLTFEECHEDLLAKNVLPPTQCEYWVGDRTSVKQLREVLQLPEVLEYQGLMDRALVDSTKANHRRELRWLLANLEERVDPEGKPDAVDAAILRSVTKTAVERAWAATTTLTKLANIQGALKALFMYRSRQVSVQLKGCARWLMALKGMNAFVQAHKPKQPLAVTEKEIKDAMAQEPSPAVRAALEVAWLAAARGGDVRQLRADDLKFLQPTKANPEPVMTVTFRFGKTARRNQYTVGVPMPSTETVAFIKQRQEERTWAFPGVTGEHIKNALRRVNKKLEQRSLRRGRLQHLARQGMSDAELLELSRHATLAMLRRYLDMGTVSSTTRKTAALAAATARSS